jgi:hypothetical protein
VKDLLSAMYELTNLFSEDREFPKSNFLNVLHEAKSSRPEAAFFAAAVKRPLY